MPHMCHLQLRGWSVVEQSIGKKGILVRLDVKCWVNELVGVLKLLAQVVVSQAWVESWVQVLVKVLGKILTEVLAKLLLVELLVHALVNVVVHVLVQGVVDVVVDVLQSLAHVVQVVLIQAAHLSHIAHIGHVAYVLHSIVETWLLVGQVIEGLPAHLSDLAVHVVQGALEIVLATLGLLEVEAKVALRLAAHLLTTARIGLILLKLCNATAEELVDNLEFADARLKRGVGGKKLLKGLWHIEIGVHRGLGATWGGCAAHVHAVHGWRVELVVDEVVAIEGRHVVAVHIWGTGAGDWGAGAIGVAVLRALGWATLLAHLVLLRGTVLSMLLVRIAEAIVVLLVEETLRITVSSRRINVERC